MDGLTVDRDEIVAAARRLSDAATTPWRPVGACGAGSPVRPGPHADTHFAIRDDGSYPIPEDW